MLSSGSTSLQRFNLWTPDSALAASEVILLWHMTQRVTRLEGWSVPPSHLGLMWCTSVNQDGTLDRSFPQRRHTPPSRSMTPPLIILQALALIIFGTSSIDVGASFSSRENDPRMVPASWQRRASIMVRCRPPHPGQWPMASSLLLHTSKWVPWSQALWGQAAAVGPSHLAKWARSSPSCNPLRHREALHGRSWKWHPIIGPWKGAGMDNPSSEGRASGRKCPLGALGRAWSRPRQTI